MTLAEALAPVSLEDFVNGYLGTRYLLTQNRGGRFASVLPWCDLNEILRHLRVHKRVGLVQNGQNLPTASHVNASGDSETSYLDARKVEKLLASGASLVVTQVDELAAGVQELAESCEDLFRIAVGVNLYAGWRTDQAFDLHWDGHDTLILQVSGRKRWKVYEPTLLHPIGGSRIEKPRPPVANPVWEGVLEDGDLLYMPRGWWHVACPLDEPTLHLTVGWQHRTGADLLKWGAGEAKRELHTRLDLPHLQSREAQTAYVAKLREVIATVLADDVVERFMRAIDEDIPVRPRLRLPIIASGATALVGSDTAIRLVSGSRVHLDPSHDGLMVMFKIGQMEWNCERALAPALRSLRATRPTTLRRMDSLVDADHHPSLHAIVMAMVSAGALWVEATT